MKHRKLYSVVDGMKEPCQVIGRDNTTPKDLFRPEFAPWRHLTSCVRTFNQFSGAGKPSAARRRRSAARRGAVLPVVPKSPHKKNSSKHDTASGLIALINEIEEDTEGVFDRLMLRASW